MILPNVIILGLTPHKLTLGSSSDHSFANQYRIGTFQGLVSAILGTKVHEPRHLIFGQDQFFATIVGQRDVG